MQGLARVVKAPIKRNRVINAIPPAHCLNGQKIKGSVMWPNTLITNQLLRLLGKGVPTTILEQRLSTEPNSQVWLWGCEEFFSSPFGICWHWRACPWSFKREFDWRLFSGVLVHEKLFHTPENGLSPTPSVTHTTKGLLQEIVDHW
jgi:hypothetical protein